MQIARTSLGVILAMGLAACVAVSDSSIDAPATSRALSLLRAALTADAFWPSLHAAEALTLEGQSSEVHSALVPRLASETDDQRRCGLARELFRAGNAAAVTVLLEILASDRPHGHLHAAESLFKVRQQGDGVALRHALAQNADARLQVMAAGALASAGDERARELIIAALRREDRPVVRTAAWLLGELRDGDVVPELRAALSHATDPLTSAFIEHALASVGEADALQGLKRSLFSADPVIRAHAAATAASGARDEEIVALLVRGLTDPDLDVRIRCAQGVLDVARRGVVPVRSIRPAAR